jgi:hypothetical protein
VQTKTDFAADTVVSAGMHIDCGIADISPVLARPGRSGEAIELITVRGMLTGSVLPKLLGYMAQIECRDGSVAALSIVDCALVTVTAEELMHAEMAQVRLGRLLNPRAVVVTAGNLPVFKRYAWLMALEGVGRLAFSDEQMAKAYAWAQSMGHQMHAQRV